MIESNDFLSMSRHPRSSSKMNKWPSLLFVALRGAKKWSSKIKKKSANLRRLSGVKFVVSLDSWHSTNDTEELPFGMGEHETRSLHRPLQRNESNLMQKSSMPTMEFYAQIVVNVFRLIADICAVCAELSHFLTRTNKVNEIYQSLAECRHQHSCLPEKTLRKSIARLSISKSFPDELIDVSSSCVLFVLNAKLFLLFSLSRRYISFVCGMRRGLIDIQEVDSKTSSLP